MIGLTMSPWLQNLLVWLLVGGCAAVVLGGVVRAFRGRSSPLGRCCAKGCPPESPAAKPVDGSQHVVFLPAESLAGRARKK
ncbi:MAG: hypothetical protein ABSH20_17160 [Tepidisphaeraceae bacterium]